MRYFEIATGTRIPISCEEQEVLDLIKSGVDIYTLDERKQEVARQMNVRGLLDPLRSSNGRPVYKVNSVTDIWRDR